ncbi:ribosomal RNA small subunit methyltransferase A [Desulfovibrio sulfodismutans]|uniref:Ribosomal RNA small subunit methyltransferase A n=1 Tax=Desulfolutivibrio sulfodismutans TaxID=63561 RepID=A0A7K3NH49_9BACT|nr:16S rRNA (adenine(1518)-N(6)/adenine(1519)-N(6))-dimethyltransferase RsmA [Desulfolutivibrio sulfodismutans]NDY55530.1 ribosomal RNA small subunit methyltransferase A [Desulfolutivibrio sulfodismutans]QLA11433.1 ribosomal RNA small subunit methyltransferase A [Desulfolutivibrio sulfodismutans DSM 3696]
MARRDKRSAVPGPRGPGESAPPKRSLGQNFLVDQNISRKIVAALDIGPQDTVLEIGPGRGALSEWIAKAGPGRYLAVEKDADLAMALPARAPGVGVAAMDALRLDWARLASLPRLKMVGNLPYNVASPLVWDLCAGVDAFEYAIFMVQHEVALRMAARPGTGEYGALTAWMGNFVTVDYLFKVPPTVFRPRPKVDSAVVRLDPLPSGPRPESLSGLAAFLKRCFSHRRKQLRHTLKAQWTDDISQIFEMNGYLPSCRPEELSPDFFRILAKTLKIHGPS